MPKGETRRHKARWHKRARSATGRCCSGALCGERARTERTTGEAGAPIGRAGAGAGAGVVGWERFRGVVGSLENIFDTCEAIAPLGQDGARFYLEGTRLIASDAAYAVKLLNKALFGATLQVSIRPCIARKLLYQILSVKCFESCSTRPSSAPHYRSLSARALPAKCEFSSSSVARGFLCHVLSVKSVEGCSTGLSSAPVSFSCIIPSCVIQAMLLSRHAFVPFYPVVHLSRSCIFPSCVIRTASGQDHG